MIFKNVLTETFCGKIKQEENNFSFDNLTTIRQDLKEVKGNKLFFNH